MLHSYAALFLACLVAGSAVAAEAPNAPNPAEAKLRDSLRATMLQLRTAESERATLQAEKATLEENVKALTEKMEALTKDGESREKVSQAAMDRLNKRLDNQSGEIARLQESLEKWKDSQKKAAALAEATEAKRARAAAEVVVLNRKVADHQAKNAAMFKLGNEILDRYEKFGLGTALTAREPFVGLTRVKFENLTQDFGDKLTGEKIKP